MSERQGRVARALPALIAASSIALFAGRVIWLMASQSPTTDEIIHIPAAYAHWRYGDASLNPEHPPVAKLVSGAGLAAFGGRIEWAPGPGFSRRFFESDWQRRTFAARLPMLLFALGVLALLTALLAWLFDPLAASLAAAALTLYSVFVAHSVFVHTDVPAAFFYLAACALVLRVRALAGGPLRLCALAAVLALGLLTKFSLVLGLPAALLALVLGSGWRRRLASAGLVVIGFAVALGVFAALAYAPESRLPLPHLLLVGWWWQVDHNRAGHESFLFMQSSSQGWRAYFPLAYLLKTPLSILGTTLVGAVVLLRRRPDWLLPWLVFVACYWIAAITSPIDIGVRLLMPVLVVMWVALGAGVQFWLSRPWGRAVGGLLLAWLVASSARDYRGELGAFGELALGRPGWRLLADSNVDWGQQAAEVARRAVRHGWQPLYADVNPLPLSLFGADAKRVSEGYTGERLRPGYYVVSAHLLASERGAPYSCFRALQPSMSFGGSCYLYELARADSASRQCPR